MRAKRKKIYRAGQKNPAVRRVDRGRIGGRFSKRNSGKTHAVKGRSANHNRTRW